MPVSLRRTLLQALGAPSLLLLVAGGGVAYGVAASVVSTAYDENLVNLAQGVANHARLEGGELRLALSREAELVLRTDTTDQIFFRARDAAGRILAGDGDLPLLEDLLLEQRNTDPYEALQRTGTPQSEPVRPPRPRNFYNANFRGEAIRAVRIYRELDHHGYFVTVAETLGKRREAMERLLLGFASAALLAGAAAGIAMRFGIPSGLAPLEHLKATLAARDGTDLSPIPTAGTPLEVSELVDALNALLARQREAHAHQREFLQDAAHQLRTPLASLQVQLEMLTGEGGDPAAIARLRQSVRRATRLANQLLTLARAEAGRRLMADAVTVDLAAVIDEMLDDWLRTADERRIDLGVERSAASVLGDPTLLRELMANLVDNALKYTPACGQVTVFCRRKDAEIELDVVDDGPGIPLEERERVFERFYRAPGARASGSGLGLPIAREIVACHGGRIAIEDGPGGRGSRLSVRLPAA